VLANCKTWHRKPENHGDGAEKDLCGSAYFISQIVAKNGVGGETLPRAGSGSLHFEVL